ncbi:PAP2 family protein [Peribacillus saganii]|uniref:PAP2 family protein n=1 Tax=Peribacillus saganii TaxID=2303992 RepID=A0A372LK61_9BACI|nr:phosphatase PAP2 family protein [Peribacillus saganii]RFU66414.1 PAP2 family protein [Peribacillus saganii]
MHFYKTITKQQILYVIAVLILFWTYVVIFVELAEEIQEKQLIEFDSRIIGFVQGFVSEKVTVLMKAITFLGSYDWIMIAVITACSLLVIYKKVSYAVYLALSSGLGAIFNKMLKRVFQRERPDIFPLIREHGFSFPSGHSMGAIVLYGTLAIIVIKIVKMRSYKVVAGAGAFFLIFMVGLSRIYLGVHYPSDVVAGFAAGAAWLILCRLGLRIYEYQKQKRGLKAELRGQ